MLCNQPAREHCTALTNNAGNMNTMDFVLVQSLIPFLHYYVLIALYYWLWMYSTMDDCIFSCVICFIVSEKAVLDNNVIGSLVVHMSSGHSCFWRESPEVMGMSELSFFLSSPRTIIEVVQPELNAVLGICIQWCMCCRFLCFVRAVVERLVETGAPFPWPVWVDNTSVAMAIMFPTKCCSWSNDGTLIRVASVQMNDPPMLIVTSFFRICWYFLFCTGEELIHEPTA